MVKHLLTKFALLAVMLVGVGMTALAADKWVLTAPAGLATGDVVVIVDQNSAKAMSNDKGTGSAPVATAVTLSDDKSEITGTVAANIQWVVTKKNASTYQFGVAGTSDYLYTTTSNNGLRVGPTNTNSHNLCGITQSNEKNYITINDANNANRYIGVYNNGGDWRSYTSVNTNIEGTITVFYKKTTIDNGKTDIATIGTELTPTEVNVGDLDDFSLNIALASNTLVEGTDYTVTWESSDDAILELADETYEAKAAGEVTITVTVTPDDTNTYNEVSREFTVKVIDPNGPGTENNPYSVAQAIANTPSSGNVYIKGIVSSFYKTSITGDGTNYRYYISDDGTTNTQLLVYKGKKSETESFSDDNDLLIGDEVVICGELITYSNAPEINQGNYIVSLIRKKNPELSFGTTTEFTCDLFGAFTAPALTFASSYDGTISYKSSDENVAVVANDGTVTIKAAGTTTITATGAATSTFSNGSASYTLTVTENEGQSAVTPSLASGKYVKVTSTDDITDGQYLIVYEEGSVAFNGGLETLDAVGNTIEVTISNNEIAATTTTKAAEFTLDVTDGTLLSASGKYIGVSSNSNGLNTTDEADTYTHTFSIDDDGNAVIAAVFENSTMTLRYNYASNQNRFRYYKSGQQAIQLYKYVAGTSSDTKKITLSSYGYKTLVASKNFTVSGATAYIVTAATGSGITTASLNVVPANEPVFLKGKANATATLTFTEDDADDASANLLAISAASTNYNGDYVLASKDDAVGFYKWNGGTLGAGRVYLPAADVPDAARSFLPFASDEATGIASAKVSQSTEQVYDLQGRRVAQPTKGLYIVNGKKMILK